MRKVWSWGVEDGAESGAGLEAAERYLHVAAGEITGHFELAGAAAMVCGVMGQELVGDG